MRLSAKSLFFQQAFRGFHAASFAPPQPNHFSLLAPASPGWEICGIAPLARGEASVVNDAAALRIVPVGDHGVEHLVIDHVLEKPRRDEGPVEQGVDADDAVFLLDGADS